MIFEKVNPKHPDKIADRIAGALLDLAYNKNKNFIAAVEVLIGHGKCLIINETNTKLDYNDVNAAVKRIAEIKYTDYIDIEYKEVKQDVHLSKNQTTLRCGDNGIFKSAKTNECEIILTCIAKTLYDEFKSDGKYIIDTDKKEIIICQSKAGFGDITYIVNNILNNFHINNYSLIINPLGFWSGGIDVDSGATNRKLGSDMGRAVTGGGLHGKDTSKADLTINTWLYLNYQDTECSCAIGDDEINIDGKTIKFSTMVEYVKNYINKIGGYEKFAEWGLIR